VPETESDIERPTTASMRKAPEVVFDIPPTTRTEPAGDSVTESESDSDDVFLPSCRASKVNSNQSKGIVAVRL
jgi:hypothetical protein